MIEFLLHAPDRATFVSTMAALRMPPPLYPADTPLATADEAGNLTPAANVLISEIGEVVKTPAVLDAEGNVVTPAVVVPGHHVNMAATGPLAAMLTAGLAQTNADGTPKGLFRRTRLLAFLGVMEDEPSSEGLPPRKVGASGVAVFDPGLVRHRANVWQ